MSDAEVSGLVAGKSANRSGDVRGPLVTVLGGSGFVGSAVLDELARLPVRLRVVARRECVLPLDRAADVEFRLLDLAEPGNIASAAADADIVVHLAAHVGGEQSWRAAGTDSERVNVGVMRDLVAAYHERSGPPPLIVFVSTLQAAPENAGAHNAYSGQKAEAEKALWDAAADDVVRGIVLRLATTYGRSPLSGDVGRGVIAAMARKAFAGESLTMWHDGSVERDLLNVRDAATAFSAALEYADELEGRSWVVGTGMMHRLGDVFRQVSESVSAHTGKPAVPVVSVEAPEFAEVGDFRSLEVDSSSFRNTTGWRNVVGLREGLAEVVEAVGESAERA